MPNKSITSISGYFVWVMSCYDDTIAKHLFFRGHSQDDWELLPSVLRGDPKYNEKEILLDFCNYADAHDISYDRIYEIDKLLGEMQHYGLPTRLLDWTVSPLVALYHACLPASDKSKDGMVYMFNPWKYTKKNVLDREKKLPNIHQVQVLARALLAYDWEENVICQYLEKIFVSVEKIFDSKMNLEHPYPLVSPFSNARKLHQRGTFMVWGKSKGCLEQNPDYCTSVCVPHKHKSEILDKLNKLYINEYTVYPDFKGMADMVKTRGGLFNIKKFRPSLS